MPRLGTARSAQRAHRNLFAQRIERVPATLCRAILFRRFQHPVNARRADFKKVLPDACGNGDSVFLKTFEHGRNHRSKQFSAEKIAFAPNAFEPQQVLLRVAALTRFGLFFQRERFRVKQANSVFVRVIAGLRKLGNDLVLLAPVCAQPILPALFS